MKRIYLIPLLAIVAGCSRPDAVADPPIRLAVTTHSGVKATTRQVIDGTSLPAGSQTGLFAFHYDAAADPWTGTPIYANACGTVGTATADGSPVALSEQRYTGALHAFYAYYPYLDGANAPSVTDPVIRSDLFANLDADGRQNDWLASRPREDIVARVTPVDLVFDHLTAMLWVKAGKSPSSATDVTLERIGVTTRQSQKFEYNLRTRVLTNKTGGATTVMLDAGHVIEPLAGIDELPTETALRIVMLPLSEVTKLTFTIDGICFETPDGWNGLVMPEAGIYTTIHLVAETGRVTLEIGELEYADGGGTTIALQKRSFEIGETPPTDGGNSGTIAGQQDGFELGQTEWNTINVEL